MSDPQIKLALLTASMSRRSGGLLPAVSSLTKAIQATSCNIRVLAGADEFSEQDRSIWGEVPLQMFPQLGPASFGYQDGLAKTLARENFNLAHVHGLWMYPSVATKRWAQSGNAYLISPHGMLDPWAVRNSAWKKQLAGFLYENAHLRSAACLHALCESERQAIRAYGLPNPVAVIPNGVDLPNHDTDLPEPKWEATLPRGAKVLFFLSRIHPKKGLVNLLHAWAKTKKVGYIEAEPWHLVIAGWEQGDHQTELENLARKLTIDSSVHFVGPQFNEAKSASFNRADAFILPSFSEGLPMAVLEAWSYGLPVIMTPQCNISEGFEVGAAHKIQPEPASIKQALLNFFSLSEMLQVSMGHRGLSLVSEKFSWQKIAKDMVSVYYWVLSGGAPPACVKFY